MQAVQARAVWVRATHIGTDAESGGRVVLVENIRGGHIAVTVPAAAVRASDHITVTEVVLPDEPPEGTWVRGPDADDEVEQVFVRRDGLSGHPAERWYDYAAGEWVMWQVAVRRGADPARALGGQL